MRYFTQVRTKALEVLIRSHCQSLKTSYALPLNDLERMLGFEGQQAAAEFCQYHGLETSTDTVTLSKMTFMMPESAVPQKRARGLVEMQLRASLSEVIAGYSLQQFEPPQPTSSFDSSTGQLTAEVLKELEDRATAPPPNISLSKNIFSSQSLFSQAGQSQVFALPGPQRTFNQAALPSAPTKPLVSMHAQQQKTSQLSLTIFQKVINDAIPALVMNNINYF